MTSEIKRTCDRYKRVLQKFGINQIINEDKRDEILAEQYEKLKFPIVFL
ncbi:hypothetical protein JMUB3936_p1045 (plasmid) [Leptotrichia wadei]|uniref:Uncharacterized protein n=1 Tax=Leptotrichia wadei TaxID=157687 RepID=A0A510L0I0_9FUSO|nr:hypothetical protein JMUB3936_p1045 [Leptotrichia wadei]